MDVVIPRPLRPLLALGFLALGGPVAGAWQADILRLTDIDRPSEGFSTFCQDDRRDATFWMFGSARSEGERAFRVRFPWDGAVGACGIQFVYTARTDATIQGILLANATVGCDGERVYTRIAVRAVVGTDPVGSEDRAFAVPQPCGLDPPLMRWAIPLRSHEVKAGQRFTLAFLVEGGPSLPGATLWLGIGEHGDQGRVVVPGLNATGFEPSTPAPRDLDFSADIASSGPVSLLVVVTLAGAFASRGKRG